MIPLIITNTKHVAFSLKYKVVTGKLNILILYSNDLNNIDQLINSQFLFWLITSVCTNYVNDTL